jgi:transposase-like protein
MTTTWTPELKEQVIEEYKEQDPTPETSTEIIKQIAEENDLSPNGVRQVLVQAGVYVKKDTTASKPTEAKGKGEGTKRVSKESQLDALREAIKARGHSVDEDIVGKLTGKAAAYFTTVLS